jgi:hypothetical protein
MVDFLCDEAGKRCPDRLSMEGLLGTKIITICLNILNVVHRLLSLISQKIDPVITLADICRLPVQYSVEKLSKLLTYIKHYMIRTIHKNNNKHDKQMLFSVPVIIHE